GWWGIGWRCWQRGGWLGDEGRLAGVAGRPQKNGKETKREHLRDNEGDRGRAGAQATQRRCEGRARALPPRAEVGRAAALAHGEISLRRIRGNYTSRSRGVVSGQLERRWGAISEGQMAVVGQLAEIRQAGSASNLLRDDGDEPLTRTEQFVNLA